VPLKSLSSSFQTKQKENNNSSGTNVDVNHNNGTYTFLQYACDQGMDHIVKFLLGKGADPNRCSPNYKFPPIVIAGHHGYYKIISVFKEMALDYINYSVDFTAVDAVRGENVLHKVLKAESRAYANYECRDYEKCLAILLDDKSSAARGLIQPLIDAADQNGNTPLHYAGQVGNEKALAKILRAGANIGIKNKCNQTPIDRIPPTLLREFLDECLQGEGYLVDEDFKLTFHYDFLGPPLQTNVGFTVHHQSDLHKPLIVEDQKEKREKLPEAEPLWYLSQSKKHRDLLCHPVITSFLCLKWRRIRPYYYFNLLFYVLFVICLTSYLLMEATELKQNEMESLSRSTRVLGYVVQSLLVLLVLRELFQALVSFRRYIFSISSLPKILLIAVLSVLFIAMPPSSENLQSRGCMSGASVLLSWTEMVLLFGRHPKCSTYIAMFRTVSVNFLLFLTWYISFILAFGFTFFIILPKENVHFLSIEKSIFKTVVMSLSGEIEFEGIVFGDNGSFAIAVFLLYIFFILLVLVNLLNGLAVSDIGVIQKQAEIVSLVSKVSLVSYIESMLLGDPFQFLSSNYPPIRLLRQLPACDCFRQIYSLHFVQQCFEKVMGRTLIFGQKHGLTEKRAIFLPNQSNFERSRHPATETGSSLRSNLLLDEQILLSATTLLSTRAASNELAELQKGIKLVAKQQLYIMEILQELKDAAK
jgi:transient receptor potential cation channel subfamily A protein 1